MISALLNLLVKRFLGLEQRPLVGLPKRTPSKSCSGADNGLIAFEAQKLPAWHGSEIRPFSGVLRLGSAAVIRVSFVRPSAFPITASCFLYTIVTPIYGSRKSQHISGGGWHYLAYCKLKLLSRLYQAVSQADAVAATGTTVHAYYKLLFCRLFQYTPREL